MGLPTPLSLLPSLGLAMRFGVKVDGMSLGMWSSCQGLAVVFKADQVAPLGVNGYKQTLMPAVEYQPIVLERAVDSRSSAELQKWLASEVANWLRAAPNGQPYIGRTAQITLFDAHAMHVMSWTLEGAYPTKWSGPKLSSRESTVATESLELTHKGFLQLNA